MAMGLLWAPPSKNFFVVKNVEQSFEIFARYV